MRLLSNILAFSLILSLGVAESQNTTKSSSDIIRTNTDNIKVVDTNKSADDVKRSSDIIAFDKNISDVTKPSSSITGIDTVPADELGSAKKAQKSSNVIKSNDIKKAHKSFLNTNKRILAPVRDKMLEHSDIKRAHKSYAYETKISPARDGVVETNSNRADCDEGYVTDCADEDCCPESWIGDGFADCADQAYGCDLTCYDNDGGDCDGGGGDGGTTGGGSDECTDCAFDFTNYGSECCDTAWYEYGIDCSSLESNYYWTVQGASVLVITVVETVAQMVALAKAVQTAM